MISDTNIVNVYRPQGAIEFTMFFFRLIQTKPNIIKIPPTESHCARSEIFLVMSSLYQDYYVH